MFTGSQADVTGNSEFCLYVQCAELSSMASQCSDIWHTTTEQLGSILKTTSTDIVNLLFSFWEPAAEAEGGLEAGHVGTDDVYRKVVPVLKCMGLLVGSEASSIKEFRLSIKS